METLAASGVKVARLAELRSTTAPAVALTFDDGFQNFADVAAPLLARYRFPATVFLVTEYCGRSNDWPSQWGGIPRLSLMSWSTIADLARAGIEFGAHTTTHADLTRLDEAAAREEILSSKQRVEEATGRPALAFAYPYGHISEPARRIVADHFSLGCSTRLGWVTDSSRAEALERLDIHYLLRPYLFRHLFEVPARCYLALRGALRELR